MSEIHINKDVSKVGFVDSNTSFTIDTGVKLNLSGKSSPGAKPTKDVQDDPLSVGSVDDVAFWGEDNLFPQNLQKTVEKSTVVLPIIEKQVAALYGGGMEYGRMVYENGEEPKFENIIDPEIEDFFEASNMPIFFRDTIDHFYFLRNFFPEMILSKNREKIVFLHALDASWCRWQIRKKGQLASDHLFYHPEWDFVTTGGDQDYEKIKVIDPGFYPVESLRERKDAWKYVYPLSWTKRGRSYYSLASWDGMRTGGWLEVLLDIPEFKKAVMKHQTKLQYHIIIKDRYWEWKYPGFNDKTSTERLSIIKKEAEYWKETLSGAKNAGKNILTTDIWNPQTQQYDVGVQVIPIDDKMKDGVYIEDSQEAVAHMSIALGWDASILGRGPGKNNNSSGSGSDKAAALQNYLALTQPHRDLIMQPLHFIAGFNGWKKRLNVIEPEGVSKKLHFRFKPPMNATKVIDGKELQNET